MNRYSLALSLSVPLSFPTLSLFCPSKCQNIAEIKFFDSRSQLRCTARRCQLEVCLSQRSHMLLSFLMPGQAVAQLSAVNICRVSFLLCKVPSIYSKRYFNYKVFVLRNDRFDCILKMRISQATFICTLASCTTYPVCFQP